MTQDLLESPLGVAAASGPLAPAAPISPVRLLNSLEPILAAIGTLLAVYLNIFLAAQVGGLWRDEVNSVNLATLPSLAETWDKLQFDSFPILFFGVMRAWTALFGVGDDAALRALGLLMGLGIIGALWLNARQLGARWPLFSLVLLGCNPMFVRYSDSMRAYGLGMLLILLTLTAIWRVLCKPLPGRVLLAAALGVLSVQTLYYNAVLLFSICVAAAVAAAAERRWKTAAICLGLGGPAAASLVIYAETIHRLHAWNFLVQYPVTLPWLWHKLGEVIGAPDPLGVWVWSGLFLLGLVGAGVRLARHNPDRGLVFATAALIVLSICYPLFLKSLNYFTQPWYYISYVALVAVGFDSIFGRLLAGKGAIAGRVARLVFLIALTGLTFEQTQTALRARQTNVDLIAGRLNTVATSGDLVVFNRWECAITFARYYHGPAELITVPPITEHRFHRYDEIKTEMMQPNPIAPVEAKIESTLRSGGRIWLVGDLVAPAAGQPSPTVAPATDEHGHFTGFGSYYDIWAEQAGYVLREHASAVINVPFGNGQPVMVYERLRLTGFQGWH